MMNSMHQVSVYKNELTFELVLFHAEETCPVISRTLHKGQNHNITKNVSETNLLKIFKDFFSGNVLMMIQHDGALHQFIIFYSGTINRNCQVGDNA